jgi:hypothetical protein
MSEQTRSNDPVVDALRLEQEIAQTLESPADASARKTVRAKMESWMQLLNDPKAARQYTEELGDLPVDVARQDVLKQIGARFPGVAKDLGWNPDAAAELHDEMAA